VTDSPQRLLGSTSTPTGATVTQLAVAGPSRGAHTMPGGFRVRGRGCRVRTPAQVRALPAHARARLPTYARACAHPGVVTQRCIYMESHLRFFSPMAGRGEGPPKVKVTFLTPVLCQLLGRLGPQFWAPVDWFGTGWLRTSPRTGLDWTGSPLVRRKFSRGASRVPDATIYR